MTITHRYIPGKAFTFDYSRLSDVVRWPNDDPSSKFGFDTEGYDWAHKDNLTPFAILKLLVPKLGMKISQYSEKLLPYFDADSVQNIVSILNKLDIENILRASVLFTGNGTELGDMDIVWPHIHTPYDHLGRPVAVSIAIIAPIKITEPVTDTICFLQQNEITWPLPSDITLEEVNRIGREIYETHDLHTAVKIAFPKANELLIVSFDGAREFHWLEGISNNHYAIFPFDLEKSVEI